MNVLDEAMVKFVRTLLARTMRRPLLFFDVEVTEHCNLNCKGCGSFAPLAEEEYIDVEGLERDLERLSFLAKGEMHHINLLGGEPLLHPEINKIMKLTRHYFPYGEIYLVTNGILLRTMPEEFWHICKEQSIIVAPTKYPIQVDYDGLKGLAQRYGVSYQYFGDASKFWSHGVVTELGNRQENYEFLHCGNANNCGVLSGGKLYPCCKVPKIRHFNKAFGTDFKVSQKDYLDIYDDITLDDIMEFYARPVPFCRYCDTYAVTGQDWARSEKKREEWT